MFSPKCAKTYHVKKNDMVKVISGSWKGSTGKIIALVKKTDRVVLEIQGISAEKLSEKVGKRTLKKSKANPNGGLVDRSVSVHVSNVEKVTEEKSGDKKNA